MKLQISALAVMKYSSRYGGFEDRCDEEDLLGFHSCVRCVVKLLILSPLLAERLSPGSDDEEGDDWEDASLAFAVM